MEIEYDSRNQGKLMDKRRPVRKSQVARKFFIYMKLSLPLDGDEGFPAGTLTGLPKDLNVSLKVTRKSTEDARNPVSESSPDHACSFWKNCGLKEGALVVAQVKSAHKMTHSPAAKRTFLLEVYYQKIGETGVVPGDSFGILAPNDHRELVLPLLQRLGCINDDFLYAASVENKPLPRDSINPACASFFSGSLSLSLKDIFTFLLDVKGVPKKSFLKSLGNYCSSERDKQCLHFLSSKEGSQEYMELATLARPTLCDILDTFRSCEPPVEFLLEHLGHILPRYYSVCSISGDSFSIVFNAEEFNVASSSVAGRGHCTGWLERIPGVPLDGNGISGCLSGISLSGGREKVNGYIPIIRRPSTDFTIKNTRIASDTPVVMVCHGTGIAPFMSFLEFRKANGHLFEFSPWHLYYGCRSRKLDFLFEKELDNYLNEGLLATMAATFSRENHSGNTKYVQDAILKNSLEIYELMALKKAVMFVCGSRLSMFKDLTSTLTEIIVQHEKIDHLAAAKAVREWKIIKEVWA